ncbi:MAG: hypothetical protein HY521_10535 [Proteobacteria bacterium]|nr:hypothetical protein [Pseudomonadota bacterium]
MSRVRVACDRLERAVGRLFEAVDAQAVVSEREREQMARLEEKVRAAQDAYRSLQRVTDTVSARLEATIGRLKSLLGD